MAEYSIYNSQWTAQQIEASIGKNPRIGESGNWEVWNMSTMQFVDTGVLAEGKSVSRVDRTSGTGLPGTTDTYTIYDDDETVIGTFDVHNGSDGQGSPGSQTPKMNGTAAVGTANAYSREDHVHPHDDSKADLVDGKVPSGQLPPMDYQPTINVSGILKGNGAGGISAAVAKEDFAPAGYGLGDGSKMLSSSDNLDTLKINGWYKWDPTNPPQGTLPSSVGLISSSALVRVWGNGAVCYQECADMTNSDAHGAKVVRTIYGNTVYPWEWVNPPMVAGVEYRTTERYLTKPVCVKTINFGALPNSTYKSVSTGYADGEIMPLSVTGHFYAGADRHAIPYDYSASEYVRFMNYTSSNVIINTSWNASAFTAYVTLKYTKDSD